MFKNIKTASDLTDEALVLLQQQSKADERAAKLTGIEFEGVMCSAMSEDMWGLAAIKADIQAGASYPFYFENGNILLLTPENMAAFEAVWKPFRASFFIPGMAWPVQEASL